MSLTSDPPLSPPRLKRVDEIWSRLDYFVQWRQREEDELKAHRRAVIFSRAQQVWSDGTRYVGSVVKGERCGHGTAYYPDGSVYTGGWLAGLWGGEGVLLRQDGTSYKGGWMRGLKHGTGKEEDLVRAVRDGRSNGKPEPEFRTDVYEGEFRLGKRHGTGLLVQGKGMRRKEVYFGEWMEDRRHGVSAVWCGAVWCDAVRCDVVCCGVVKSALNLTPREGRFDTEMVQSLKETGGETASTGEDGFTCPTQDHHFSGCGRKESEWRPCLWRRE